MTKRLPLEVKLARKATRVACEFCHHKHLQCDDKRPCTNCTKRGFQDSCRDSVRKKKSVYKDKPRPSNPRQTSDVSLSGSSGTSVPSTVLPTTASPVKTFELSPFVFAPELRNFESSIANDEYVQLTDLLNTNPPSPTDEFVEIEDDDEDFRPFVEINTESLSMRTSYPNNETPNSYVYNEHHSQMPNTASMVPVAPEEDEYYTAPSLVRKQVQHPDDIYLTPVIRAYRYPQAYHALIHYLKKRFSKYQLIEIAKCMAKYRPSFISATKSLHENDLLFTERSFQRSLLEYEHLISMSPSPIIIWRRTGEIVALTDTFAVMTGYSRKALLSKRTYIVELMDDESTIKYFRSFSELAFGDLNATYLTDCNLRKAEENNYLRCCCIWTIKRDVFDIPMLIVGQFLPVLERQ
ncbi:hypothetical protein OGAPHI_002008 [Ogataea philodendri]|uniref:Glucose starvation modulator protein 1 n=1 Tax=Ogataea philodendri TaxID=1378263 RepID=A0A9P8T7A0_9ASCO|nr:uncharacterized protein OGAPHI_002008 [Ogataea philodendri]KAH3668254.1 hypothetical protein OGAPHI_002008 [Ogataea philodendri]